MPKDEPETQYTPKGHEIPVPTRGEFAANLDKLVKAPAPDKPKRKSARRPSRPGDQ